MIITNNKPLLDIARVGDLTYIQDERHCGVYRGITIRSVFQPIYSLVHARIVGAEGLMRCTALNGDPISPLEMLYTKCRSEADSVLLDRLCRYLHVKNAISLLPSPDWLFLNVSPRIVIAGRRYGAFFKELLQQSGMPPNRIVVEILEDPSHEEEQLHKAVDYFRELGCVIAVDDFGTGHSNFSRVWEINPDIVKLDRSLVVRAAFDARISRTLPNLVDLLHESGCHVLMEGIENESEAITAVSAGVDMVQGNYFARPGPNLETLMPVDALVRDSHVKYIHTTRDRACSLAYTLKPYVEIFNTVLAKPSVVGITSAIQQLLTLPYVLRCYILDECGKQIGSSYLPPKSWLANAKFAVLANGEGADWSTRRYFRMATNAPNEVQISEQYFSIPDGSMCVTLSIACRVEGDMQVFCCDLKWE
jgi:EAL domain-containing protein (putative c-di-GMP-specific phosphodiesterase class I)